MVGFGKGIVLATGDRTVLGQIFDMVVAFEKKRPFIYTRVQQLVRFLAACAVGLGGILYISSCSSGWFWLDTLIYLMIVTILIIPDSALFYVTASLTISAKRMASEKCLVKNLESAGILALISTICCGKKDVITQNIQTIRSLWLDAGIFHFGEDHKNSEQNPFTNSKSWPDFVRALMLCNSNEFQSLLIKNSHSKEPSAISFEQATMSFLRKHEEDFAYYQEKYNKVFEVPYNPNFSKYHVQNVKLGVHQTCLSINRLWHELCDMLRRLVGTTAPGHHDCSIQEWKS
ncbi:hypothetical protein TNCV_2025521 [Trichonephila clavipes]|nr:hypothetical protein TNCV_2025521 [Trichonephila clavipes]